MTLGVLAPYRGLGIVTRLLNHALDLCIKQSISEIYLHVQTINEDANNFYKKFSFKMTGTIQNYYSNIVPPDCYVLTKELGIIFGTVFAFAFAGLLNYTKHYLLFERIGKVIKGSAAALAGSVETLDDSVKHLC